MFTFTSGVVVGLVGGVAIAYFLPKVWGWMLRKFGKGVRKL